MFLEKEKLIKLINDNNVISFDIFDTLIIRTYNKPTDLFMHIELSKKAKGFCKARIDAECKAREKAFALAKQEVSFNEIYDNIHRKYKNFKQIEIEQELRVVLPIKICLKYLIMLKILASELLLRQICICLKMSLSKY